MANAPNPNEAHAEAVADAKRLMRLARAGALATLEAAGGAPLTTLVGIASDFDGAPLFLMSMLSRHTRNLARDPRASLLLTGRHERGDPLNHPRVTLSGRVERCAANRAKVLERGLLRMDPERHTCTWKNEPVTLTVTEFLILQALAQRPGVVKSRNALMDAAYDDQVYVDDRTIDSHIKRLRKKFKQSDDDFDMIETLYGVGYRFKEM